MVCDECGSVARFVIKLAKWAPVNRNLLVHFNTPKEGHQPRDNIIIIIGWEHDLCGIHASCQLPQLVWAYTNSGGYWLGKCRLYKFIIHVSAKTNSSSSPEKNRDWEYVTWLAPLFHHPRDAPDHCLYPYYSTGHAMLNFYRFIENIGHRQSSTEVGEACAAPVEIVPDV